MKYEKQDQIIRNSQSRINLLDGSVRSGKTVGANKWWLSYLTHHHTKGDLLMTGKTLTSLERNVLSPLADLGLCEWSKGNKEATIAGKKVYLEGANDARSESKIRGMTIAGHYGDEVALWPESYFKQSLARMSIKGSKAIFTTNPENPNHWLKQDWIDREDELDLSHNTLYIDDNPYLADDYVNSLKNEYTGVWYKRYIQSLWVAAEGAVYDMFDEDRHVIDRGDVPKCYRYWLGADYGTASVTAFVLLGQARNGNIYALDEYYYDSRKKGRQKTDTQLAEDLKEFQQGISHTGVCCDPSAVSFMVQAKRKHNIRMIAANNEVLEGIRNVSSLLSNNLLYICDGCTNLINEMHTYSWDIKKQEQGIDKPLKQSDHMLDSLRYSVMTKYNYWKKQLLAA